MRVLITGASGFVGPHLAWAFGDACKDDVEILPTARISTSHPVLGHVEALDVTDRAMVDTAIKRHMPTHVVHLAGIASPVAAAKNPDQAWRVHVDGTRNIAYSIMEHASHCTLIHAGSGLIYGESAKAGLPLDENTLPAPIDEYGASKAAADLALGALATRGLKVVRMRPFNHAGAGQTEEFVTTAFAMQVARIEAGLSEPVIHVGNLDAERDFLDVRDVAAAYVRVASEAASIAPAAIFNLASGRGYKIADVLRRLLSLSPKAIEIRPDPERQRASDLPRVVGNAQKARDKLNWKPAYSLDDTIAEVLSDCRRRVAAERPGK
ncbi:NAD-dependent epimerase/dehydratase family protein [Nitratireductor aquibiodomus]|uniref:NAD-dependent epimerase/dehydratase family protein n=1 Tax=Nitratireductor aquibiodomus TaxID=204799 RepID=UPI0005609316|nr:GDP-mannose 4,6-dehydratase [Nitratireductor aquibiodomus]